MTEVQNVGDAGQNPPSGGETAPQPTLAERIVAEAAAAAKARAAGAAAAEVTEPARDAEITEHAAEITPLESEITVAESEVTMPAGEVTAPAAEVAAPAETGEAPAPIPLAVDPQEFDDEDELSEVEFRSALEAMLLVVDAPAPTELLASALRDHPVRVEAALREMSAELTARRSGMDLRFVGDGWRYYTRTEFAPYVERMLLDGARSKLTRAALETMAVIAYRQPVTRARVSAVRGVNVDGVIRTLLARGLIAEAGADPETNGTLYITTELFLERIGLASLADLPPLAPLLPGVDLIDEINESLDTDPRYTRLKKPAVADIDLGTED
ncbi:SMC-Scp complex subunit ScpB [Nocardia tengchongensis]